MCEPVTLTKLAVAAIGTGMYMQDRSLRKSIKAGDAFRAAENERQMGYENTAREQLDTARDNFSREAVDTSMGENLVALRDAFAAASQTPSAARDILASGGNNVTVQDVQRQAFQAAADDNMEKANLQANLDAFGQTLIENNPLLEKSAAASNLASNFARGSLGALNSEMAYAQTKANNPLAQLLQIGGQIALGNALAGPAGGAAGGATEVATTAGNTGTGAPVYAAPLPPLPYNPYTGT